MSYDLQVWSVMPTRKDFLAKSLQWEPATRGWAYGANNWQLVVSASERVEHEDIPEEISAALPGIEWLTDLNLEGKANAKALRLAQSTAAVIAKIGHGVVLDPQDGSVRLPSGVKRFMQPRRKDTFDVLSMSWWFLDSPMEHPEGREQFIAVLERLLPEALPRRYGLYEPPQHRYTETGRAHFLQFLTDNIHDMVVWYPQRPVVSAYLHFPHPLGAHPQGFRTNSLTIEVEKAALAEPGWTTNLKRFWRAASALVNPLYGDVRILRGYKWMGATVSAGQEHPVIGWWWAGIPTKLGNAVVLGNVYQKLWPSFTEAATKFDSLAFASLDDWSTEGDLVESLGPPPHDQVQVPYRFGGVMNQEIYREYQAEVRRVGANNVLREYPQGWPFGSPFSR